ncbi:MAG: DNA recombination protein RmuC [Phycisphaerales bacterium]|nr:DNA recombination protein RmuC [Phycisphaerales bacterium]
MTDAILILVAIGLGINVVLVILLLRRVSNDTKEQSAVDLDGAFADIKQEVERSRGDALKVAQGLREEVSGSLGKVNQTLIDAIFRLTESVEKRMQVLQVDNQRQLERIRVTVDEKLQGTLEKRLGENFKIVADRLETVHRGLGEMRELATDVGDLKRVLTNVKARGMWGELQVESLLEQVLTPDQYEKNVETVPASNRRVEFAVKFPGSDQGSIPHVWLPIDSKFPREDYERLLAAEEQADPEAVASARASLLQSIYREAKSIREKYVSPPYTTDVAILFLPTEGLFAEVLREGQTIERLQREQRVVVAGPTTLSALLTSLRMGFRTLAIEKRSGEVWELLGTVKSEFGKFGDILDRVKRQLDTATRSIEESGVRSRAIERKLRDVSELPASSAGDKSQMPEIQKDLKEFLDVPASGND